MNRRTFMPSQIALIGATNRELLVSSIRDYDLEAESYLVSRIVKLNSERRSALALGKLYLRKYPDEGRQRYLLNAIILDNNNLFDIGPIPEKMLRQIIKQKHLSDFANNRTISLNGWVLSKTECLLSALVYLFAGT